MMNTEYNLFSEEMQVRKPNREHYPYRIEILEDYLIKYCQKYNTDKVQHKIILDNIGEFYGYFDELEQKPHTPFNNLTARRELTDDLLWLSLNSTSDYIFTGQGFAVYDWQITKRDHELSVEAYRAFRKRSVLRLKVAQKKQLVFNLESGDIEKIESEIKSYDDEINEQIETIKKIVKRGKEWFSERTS